MSAKKLMYIAYMCYNTYNAVIENLPHFKKYTEIHNWDS